MAYFNVYLEKGNKYCEREHKCLHNSMDPQSVPQIPLTHYLITALWQLSGETLYMEPECFTLLPASFLSQSESETLFSSS